MITHPFKLLIGILYLAIGAGLLFSAEAVKNWNLFLCLLIASGLLNLIDFAFPLLRKRKQKAPTYHDVVVHCGNKVFDMGRQHGIELTCNKVGGWTLWAAGGQREKWIELGGEYGKAPFSIRVDDMLICESKGSNEEDE